MSQHGSARSRRKPHGNNQETRGAGSKRWGRHPVMPTAKAQEYQGRQEIISEARDEYLGPPPEDENLFEVSSPLYSPPELNVLTAKPMAQVTLVIPGNVVLQELCDTSCFDPFRKAHQVWIVQDKANRIHIHSRALPNLKESFAEINWALHEMRVAQHNVSSLFLVQLPIEGECPITVELDCRPQASPQTHAKQLIPVQEAFHIVNGLMEKLRPSFVSATETLQGRPRHSLQMRVDFGHVKIRRRKKITQGNGTGNEMPFGDFANMTSQYGKRGGADFEAKLAGSELSLKTIRHLLQPGTEFFYTHQHLAFSASISIKLKSNILEAEIGRSDGGTAALASARLMTPDGCPPVKWTVLAPDRKYDWCLRVDSHADILPIPTQELNLVRSIVVKSDTQETPTGEAFLPRPLKVKIKNAHQWRDKIDQILLRSTVAIPFRDTHYVMDVSLNQLWQGVDTDAHPQSWQSLGFYGAHWAAELNSFNTTETRRDWGVGQRNVWRGLADTAEGQFEEFLRHVLEALSALDGVQP